MKKFLAFSMLFLLIFAAACGKGETSNGTEKEGEKKIDQAELKSELLDFQAEIVDVLKENNKPFAEFEASKVKMNDPEVADEEKPSKDEVTSKMEEAKAAGPKAAEAIRSIEVPSKLDQYTKEINTALDDAAKSYEVRADHLMLEKSEDNQKEADALFASFEKKMGKVFEDADLLAPSFKKELE